MWARWVVLVVERRPSLEKHRPPGRSTSAVLVVVAASWRHYRAHAPTLTVLALPVAVYALVASVVQPAGSPYSPTAAALGCLLTLLGYPFFSVMTGALVQAVQLQLVRQAPGPGLVLRLLRRRLRSLLAVPLAAARRLPEWGVSVLVVAGLGLIPPEAPAEAECAAAVAALLGGTALLIGFLRLAFSVPAVIVEQLEPAAAVERSLDLTRGNWWRIAAVTFLLSLLPAAAGLGLGWLVRQVSADLAETLPGTLLQAAGPALASLVYSPLGAVGTTLLYYDVRRTRG